MPNKAVSPAPDLDSLLGEAIAEDAEALAALHDRELTPALLQALRAENFPDRLALSPRSVEARSAWHLMAEVIDALPVGVDTALLDDLAAEYAAIYLTGAYGASPCESVWTDDDHLICQDAMFCLRGVYARHGLATPDWRRRPEDHLVTQLLFIAHLARRLAHRENWNELADLLDAHLLCWIDDFAGRLASRARLPFYSALAILTATWLETLRELITRQTGKARPSREASEAKSRSTAPPAAQPVAFVPGVGPSW